MAAGAQYGHPGYREVEVNHTYRFDDRAISVTQVKSDRHRKEKKKEKKEKSNEWTSKKFR